MKLLNQNSLAVTIDAINEKIFFNQPISGSEKKEVAIWLAGRQGLPGSYAGMFAPTKSDISLGFKVFTGEPVRTGAATRHILGEETCRVLIVLGIKSPEVKKALASATEGIESRIMDSVSRGYQIGTYCCGICTDSFWRHLAVGGMPQLDPDKWFAAGMKYLHSLQKGDGEWQRYPFFYTLLALNELDTPAAVKELKYAAPKLEQYLKRANQKGKYSERRKVLAERILNKIS
ncbi:MAG: hypothetical protein ACE14V_03760 [bacterium]